MAASLPPIALPGTKYSSFFKLSGGIRGSIVERRPGDPATLVANPSKAHEVLGWKAQYSDLETLLATTWKAYLANEK